MGDGSCFVPKLDACGAEGCFSGSFQRNAPSWLPSGSDTSSTIDCIRMREIAIMARRIRHHFSTRELRGRIRPLLAQMSADECR